MKSKKETRGRKSYKLDEDDVRKDHNLKLSKNEKKILNDAISIEGGSRSDFIREAAIKKAKSIIRKKDKKS